MGQNIHPTAIVDTAQTGKNISIGPYSIIGSDVILGDNCVIKNNVTIDGTTIISDDVYIGSYCNIGTAAHFKNKNKEITRITGKIVIDKGNHFENNVSVKGNTTLGEKNFIGAYTTLGFPAQDKGNSEKPVYLEIGDNNDIREYVSINCGSYGGSGITTIGNDNMIMSYAHFAHDNILGNNCTIANCSTMAGHVEIGDNVITGGFAGVHQFCKIGDFAMLGGMTGVAQDVAPYLLVSGARGTVFGINAIGLKRNGFSQEEIKDANQIYNIFFKQGLTTKKAIDKLKAEIPMNRVLIPFLDFLENSNRGILRSAI